jgi:hypothetical protein
MRRNLVLRTNQDEFSPRVPQVAERQAWNGQASGSAAVRQCGCFGQHEPSRLAMSATIDGRRRYGKEDCNYRSVLELKCWCVNDARRRGAGRGAALQPEITGSAGRDTICSIAILFVTLGEQDGTNEALHSLLTPARSRAYRQLQRSIFW